MIDTIHLSISLPEPIIQQLELWAPSRIRKLNSTFEVIWEKASLGVPSWYPYMLLSIDRYRRLSIQFSVHKLLFSKIHGIRYNHCNYNFKAGVELIPYVLMELSNFLNIEIPIYSDIIHIQRIDIGVVFEIQNIETLEFYSNLRKHFGRSFKATAHFGIENENQHAGKYATALHYGSKWITKKIYSKEFELQKHYKETIKSSTSLNNQIRLSNFLDTVKYRHRIEYGYNSQFLKQKGFDTFFDLLMHSNTFYTYLCKPLIYQALELQNIIKNNHFETNFQKLKPKELYLLDLIKEYGYKIASMQYQKEYSRSDFYNQANNLKSKGINPHFLYHSQINYQELSRNEPQISIPEFVNFDESLFSNNVYWLT